MVISTKSQHTHTLIVPPQFFQPYPLHEITGSVGVEDEVGHSLFLILTFEKAPLTPKIDYALFLVVLHAKLYS